MKNQFPNNTVMLIFSKNRALQCDLCLNSFYKCCQDEFLPEINVLYKADPEHEKSYKTLFSEHPFVTPVKEDNFKEQVLEILSHKTYILFCVDDTIWTNDLNLRKVTNIVGSGISRIGFSFRLGFNTNYCYSLNQPQYMSLQRNVISDNVISYNWLDSTCDFQYALEVSSSLYRSKDIFYILENRYFKNPNELESLLYANLANFYPSKDRLVCYKQSVAFASPNNRVQNVALANRFSSNKNYLPDNLLQLYEEGFRIDYNKFYKFVSNAAHQEVEYEFTKENTNE